MPRTQKPKVGGTGRLEGAPITPNADVRQIVMESFSIVKNQLKDELIQSVKEQVQLLGEDIRKSTRTNMNAMEARIYKEIAKTDDRVTHLTKEVKDIKFDLQNVKSDLQNVKSDLQNVKSDLQNVKSDLQNVKSDLQNVKSDIYNMKTDIHNMKEDMSKMLHIMGNFAEKLTSVNETLGVLFEKKQGGKVRK